MLGEHANTHGRYTRYLDMRVVWCPVWLWIGKHLFHSISEGVYIGTLRCIARDVWFGSASAYLADAYAVVSRGRGKGRALRHNGWWQALLLAHGITHFLPQRPACGFALWCSQFPVCAFMNARKVGLMTEWDGANCNI